MLRLAAPNMGQLEGLVTRGGLTRQSHFKIAALPGATRRVAVQNNAPAAASAQIGAISFEFYPDP